MMLMDLGEWFQAAETGDVAKIREMIVRGIDVMARDSQDRTAFHIASQNRYTDIMTTILAAKQMTYLKSLGVDLFSADTLGQGDGPTTSKTSKAIG